MLSFKVIVHWILEKIFKVLTIYGHCGHLGHVTKNLALIGQALSQKKMFEINGHIHVYSPGEGADNPLG